MRIVTRPDFDGIVCAALLYEAENIKKGVKWISPNDMQKGLVNIQKGDIIANLPYDKRCSLWFDHHYSNLTNELFKGFFKIAPSAAGLVFKYYKNKFQFDYRELIKETDKIDSANLSLNEILHPEVNPYLILSMTISSHDNSEEPYWNKLVDLLRKFEIKDILKIPEIKHRCETTVEQNKKYKISLKEHTVIKEHVSVTDFRMLDETPTGNRFLVYSLFPESIVNVKIRYDSKDKEKLIVSVGHSTLNRTCKVNAGKMLSEFEGGGHKGAASCSFHISKADDYLPKILDILLKNEPNED